MQNKAYPTWPGDFAGEFKKCMDKIQCLIIRKWLNIMPPEKARRAKERENKGIWPMKSQ